MEEKSIVMTGVADDPNVARGPRQSVGNKGTVGVSWCGEKWGSTKAGSQRHRGSC